MYLSAYDEYIHLYIYVCVLYIIVNVPLNDVIWYYEHVQYWLSAFLQ